MNASEMQNTSRELGVSLTQEQAEHFAIYHACILKWQKTTNLVSQRDIGEIGHRHFLDSLSILSSAKIPDGTHLADVGSGAGFPGLPIAIARSELSVVLIESNRRKASFLREVVRHLKIGHRSEVVHARAETVGLAVDTVVSRAVSSVEESVKNCCGLISPGGQLILYKGPRVEQELREARKTLTRLHVVVESVQDAPSALNTNRVHVILRKTCT